MFVMQHIPQKGITGSTVIKRILDLVQAVLLLIIVSPLMGLIAFLIKLDSKGPILFKQQRVGQYGRPFTFYKFRTMDADADSAAHQAYIKRLIAGTAETHTDPETGEAVLKMVNDKRITRLGRILRKRSMDELPQLFNVVRGDMSLVGPRPAIPYEVAEYKDWHMRRLEAKPGITGYWQVYGRSQVTFDEMIKMDLYYIDRQSFWLDLKLLLMTPKAIWIGRGAG